MSESKRKKPTGCIDVVYLPPAPRGASGMASLPSDRCREHVDTVVRLMNESGVEKVFITPCKLWSCDRSVHCDGSELDDILRFTVPHPRKFVGIGGYNPFAIPESLKNTGTGILRHGFRGVYAHPSRYGITCTDRRMYPLYLKAMEWHVPVILDLGTLAHESPVATAKCTKHIADEFPELSCVIAHSEWSRDEMLGLVEEFPNLNFSFDTASLLFPEVRAFLKEPIAQKRSMWGSNGVPWKNALSEITRAGIPGRDGLLRHNASRVFELNLPSDKKAKNYVPKFECEELVIAE